MADADGSHPDLVPTPFTWFVRGCGCLFVLGVLAAIFLPTVHRHPPGALIASCANNLKQLELSFRWYAEDDANALYPPLSSELGRLAFAWESVYPEYVPDPYVNLCPAKSDRPKIQYDTEYTPRILEQFFDDKSYFYLGYAARNDEDGHVEFIEYPGKWPMTEKTVRILNELDALGGPQL